MFGSATLLTLLRLGERNLARLCDSTSELFLQGLFQTAGHLLELVDRRQQAGFGRQGQFLRVTGYLDNMRSAREAQGLAGGRSKGSMGMRHSLLALTSF